jgi:acetyl-CoA carboxylase alpha subunit
MTTRFSSEQLGKILEQAMLYQCACPAQVTRLLTEIHSLERYQQQCLDQTNTDVAVHQRIAVALQTIRPEVEDCLETILCEEGWDMDSLEMPEALQKQLLEEASR